MKVNWAVMFAGALGVITLAGFHGGCGRRHGHRDMGKAMAARFDDLLDDLRVSDAQRTQLVAIKERLAKQGATLQAGSGAAHARLLELWDAPTPDVAGLRALADAKIEELRKFSYAAIDAAAEAHQVLTPEQRVQLSRKLHRHLEE
ncbi:MAG TPA: Spy/CpxP family protein refolding chaperone [Anaeromyxobacteraceae bacterium]|jgi:Spy/CpxP family protein refolding chaperone|nr:Spy/CpxP family protein refolding chaperone [Anaeromyxobacteraceae bacterium]